MLVRPSRIRAVLRFRGGGFGAGVIFELFEDCDSCGRVVGLCDEVGAYGRKIVVCAVLEKADLLG